MPGVNEELAATSIWGTQQLGFAPPGTNKFDGVFGIWYGKGPGVDRCSDVFKHANMAGTTPWGGVIAVAGDDHVAKSSTAAHQSDHIFKACGLPVFFPSTVQEILDLRPMARLPHAPAYLLGMIDVRGRGVPETEIVLYGESIGTGVAVQV